MTDIWRSNSSGRRKAKEMLGIILGVFTILLGAKGFTATGLPLTKTRNLTGPIAKILGVACLLLGTFFVLEGLGVTARMIRNASGIRSTPISNPTANSSVNPSTNSWVRFESDYGNFTALFPVQPTRQDNDGVTSFISVSPAKDLILSVSAMPDANTELSLRDLQEMMCNQMQGANFAAKALEMYGHPGMEASFERDAHGVHERFRHRGFFSHGWLYQVMTIDHSRLGNHPDIDRFFAGIEFHPEKNIAPWVRYQSESGHFSALFPTQPTEVDQDGMTKISATTPADDMLVTVYISPNTETDTSLRDRLNAICKKLNAHDISSTETEMYGRQGLESTFDAESNDVGQRWRHRMFYAKGSLYQVLTVDLTPQRNHPDANRLFENFEIGPDDEKKN